MGELHRMGKASQPEEGRIRGGGIRCTMLNKLAIGLFKILVIRFSNFGYIPSITPKPQEGRLINDYQQNYQTNKPLGKDEEQQGKDGTDEKPSNKGKSQKITKALINIGNLQAGSISNASGIFSGKNIQIGWSSHGKANSGFGTIGGHHHKVTHNTNFVIDNDQIDTPIEDRSATLSPFPAK